MAMLLIMSRENRSDANDSPVGIFRRISDHLSRRSFMANSAKVGGGALALSASGPIPVSAGQDGDCGLEKPGRTDQPAQEVQEFFETFAENAKPIHTLSTNQARKAYQKLFIENVSPEEAGNTVGSVENREIPGPDDNQIPIRIYTPTEGEEPFPVMVYFHGGGWVLGGLDTHDSVARSLTNISGAMMVSVDYRLAPENPFPAAVKDAVAATKWVMQNAQEIGADPERVASVARVRAPISRRSQPSR